MAHRGRSATPSRSRTTMATPAGSAKTGLRGLPVAFMASSARRLRGYRRCWEKSASTHSLRVCACSAARGPGRSLESARFPACRTGMPRTPLRGRADGPGAAQPDRHRPERSRPAGRCRTRCSIPASPAIQHARQRHDPGTGSNGSATSARSPSTGSWNAGFWSAGRPAPVGVPVPALRADRRQGRTGNEATDHGRAVQRRDPSSLVTSQRTKRYRQRRADPVRQGAILCRSRCIQ